MQRSIKSIFESITPENIKDIDVIQDAMDIFLEILDEKSKESIDISNIYKNETIKEELIKIYLDDLYNALNALEYNQSVKERINEVNELANTEYYKIDAIKNFSEFIKDEHFLTSKTFKQKKGTAESIKYIYNMLSSFIITDNTQASFILEELGPFNFKVTGNLLKEIYDNIVRPIAHPLGFVYLYSVLEAIEINDFFNINIELLDPEVKIVCHSGNIALFTEKYESLDSTNELREEYISKINISTGLNYTAEEFDLYVKDNILWDYKLVDYIIEDGNNLLERTFIFDNNTQFSTNTRKLVDKYWKDTADSEIVLYDQNGGIIRIWGNTVNDIHCSTNLTYKTKNEIITTQSTLNFMGIKHFEDFYGINVCTHIIGNALVVNTFEVCGGEDTILQEDEEYRLTFGYNIDSTLLYIDDIPNGFIIGTQGLFIGVDDVNDFYPYDDITETFDITTI